MERIAEAVSKFAALTVVVIGLTAPIWIPALIIGFVLVTVWKC